MEQQLFLLSSPTFVLRKPNGSKPTNIYLSFTYNGIQIRLATGIKVYPEQWSKAKQEAIISHRFTKLDNRNNMIANDKIADLKRLFSECLLYLCDNVSEIEHGEEYIKSQIYKDMVRNDNQLRATIQMDIWVDKEKSQIKESTRESYHAAVKRIRKYLKDNDIPDSWDSFDYNFLKDYEATFSNYDTYKTNFTTFLWLLEMADNTRDIDYNRRDKDVLRYQIRGRTNDDIKVKIGVALTKEELLRFYSWKPDESFKDKVRDYARRKEKKTTVIWRSEELILMVRDMFTLQCLIGQRMSDMVTVIETEPVNDCITIIPQKTDTHNTLSIIPLKTKPMEVDLIARLLSDIKSNDNYKKYKTTNNSYVNHSLKFIAEQVGLDRKVSNVEREILLGLDKINGTPVYDVITSHDGRYSFITQMYKSKVPKEAIIQITGHATTQMVDKVYTILSADNRKDTLIETMNEVEKNKLNKTESETKQIQDINKEATLLIDEMITTKDLESLKENRDSIIATIVGVVSMMPNKGNVKDTVSIAMDVALSMLLEGDSMEKISKTLLNGFTQMNISYSPTMGGYAIIPDSKSDIVPKLKE